MRRQRTLTQTHKDRISAAVSKYWDSAARARQSARLLGRGAGWRHSKAAKAALRAKAKARWADPAYRERMLQGQATSAKNRLRREDAALRQLERDAARYPCRVCGVGTMRNPEKTCTRCQTRLPRPGRGNKRGRQGLRGDGYIKARLPLRGALEHRAVMGVGPGDPRVVHHVNGDKADNEPTHLEVFASQSAHSQYHAALRTARRVS